ncbi:MAG: hypothetical protein ACFFDK_09485, partial [Promethearchaeota archaeon]
FIEEIQFLMYLTTIFLGIQLIIYIFYHFLKVKNEGLPLNKRILIYGLILIFGGNILSVISLISILEIIVNSVPSEYIIIIFSIGISLLIVGFMLTLVGLYAFPAFYGVKWEGNILKLYIINEKNNICLYSHDFSKVKSEQTQKADEQLFSVGVIGIDIVLSAITNTRGEKINKIKQADSLILLEYGSDFSPQIIYALVVRKDLKSNIYFLKSIKNQFENFYKEILKELDSLKGSEEQLFGSFDIIIEDVIY